MTAPTVVVLAGGQGTRMRSRLPKVLHEVCGRPMIAWPVAAAFEAGASRVIVVASPGTNLEEHLPEDVTVAIQEEPRGTGHALLCAADHLDPDAGLVVLSGDVPLVTATSISELAQARERDGAAATVATMELDDPGQYGRVVRGENGAVQRVVETKVAGDATAEELAITEVNAGVYAFAAGAVLDALRQVEPDNAQGEVYLPEALTILGADGSKVTAHRLGDPTVMLGVNDRADLAIVRAHAQRRIHTAHMRAGVTIVDPATTLIDAGVALGQDTLIEPSSFLRGETVVGERCRIGPLTMIIDSTVADEVQILHSYVTGSTVDDGATIGPFAYLRPGTRLRAGAKAGTFVEIKNSDIGEGTKVPHLSYVGDADIGEHSNIGAGNITANYDGRRKHRTRIGKRVRTSVDTAFVAPVTVGDDAYTGAGSVITDDVPDGALGIARARQTNVEGYARRKDEEEA